MVICLFVTFAEGSSDKLRLKELTFMDGMFKIV